MRSVSNSCPCSKATERTQGVDAARAILQRATRVFVKRHAEAHLALARFEERHGDVEAARAAYTHVAEEVAPGRASHLSSSSAQLRRRSHYLENNTYRGISVSSSAGVGSLEACVEFCTL